MTGGPKDACELSWSQLSCDTPNDGLSAPFYRHCVCEFLPHEVGGLLISLDELEDRCPGLTSLASWCTDRCGHLVIISLLNVNCMMNGGGLHDLQSLLGGLLSPWRCEVAWLPVFRVLPIYI